MNMLEHAIQYTRSGLKVLPVPFKRKAPTINGWQSLYLTEALLPQFFPEGKHHNIGVLLGEPSGWIVDVDLDHPLAVELAEQFLPHTPAKFGRASKMNSHWIFRVTGPVTTKKYKSKIHGSLVELRSTGLQTVFPPSVHPSGENIEWHEPRGEPASVDPDQLFKAVESLATAVSKALGEGEEQDRDDDVQGAPEVAGAVTDRMSACLDAMKRMKVIDQNDGSHRLFAAACRAVEWDLDDDSAIACIRTYAAHASFPREWTDGEITQRIRDAEKTTTRGKSLQETTSAANNKPASQATVLVELCRDVHLFHDDETAYATLKIGERLETLKVRSNPFRSWLARQFFEATGAVAGGQAQTDAIAVLDGKARFTGPQMTAHVRLAEHEGIIYLDLADADRNVVVITAQGWTVQTDVPVRFRRPRGLKPLPIPTTGGTLRTLREFINLEDESSFILLAAWLVAAMRPGLPLPVLIFHSEQGSGKSTTSRLLRSLIDPNAAPIRCQPREPRDLMIAANNASMVVLDNLSGMSIWLSDALCRLSTGGGFSTRAMYENEDEVLFNALRPVILNGIDDIATRSDLLDRALRIALPTIPENRRQPERSIYERFAQEQPAMLGALLTAVSTALNRIGQVELDHSPRMADFAQWIVAAEPALPWASGAFMSAYCDNRASAHDVAIESSPVGEAMLRFAQRESPWSGTSTELLRALEEITDEPTCRQSDWPKKPHSLSGALKRITPNLRAIGVEVEFPKRKGKRRQINIRTLPGNSVTSVTERHNHASNGEIARANDAPPGSNDAPVTLGPCENELGVTLDDAGDAQSPECSKADPWLFQQPAGVGTGDNGQISDWGTI